MRFEHAISISAAILRLHCVAMLEHGAGRMHFDEEIGFKILGPVF